MGALKNVRQRVRNRLYRIAFGKGVIENLGVRLCVDHAAVSDRMFFALARNYERNEAELAAKFISSDSRVLEVGAGVGFLACHCMKNLGVRDYAMVEANPELVGLIEQNLKLNGLSSAQVFNFIVSAGDGEADFSVAEHFWASSTVALPGAKRIALRAVSLETLRAKLGFAPNTLIMDIEGGEIDIPIEHYEAFSGILMETHPGIVGTQAVQLLIQKLANVGFALRDQRGHVVWLSRDVVG